VPFVIMFGCIVLVVVFLVAVLPPRWSKIVAYTWYILMAISMGFLLLRMLIPG